MKKFRFLLLDAGPIIKLFISLEEILKQIGLYRSLEWQYTKKFREHYTRLGQKDFIQDRGLQ